MPPIETGISYDDSTPGAEEIELKWNYPTSSGLLVKSQGLEVAYDCQTTSTLNGSANATCDWQKFPLGTGVRAWIELMDNEPVKFYKIFAKVEIGCKPECDYQGTENEGWYDSCTKDLIKKDRCAGKIAVCSHVGTRSEGWYVSAGQGASGAVAYANKENLGNEKTITFASVTPPVNGGGETGELIIYTQCSQQVKDCDIESEIHLRFVQEIFKQDKVRGQRTSVNYVTNLLGHNSSYEMINSIPSDYVAKWDCSRQRNEGTALGMCTGIIPCVPYATGVFDMVHGYPYFVSATADKRFVWASVLPEHITFNLCPGRNYINLPIDTQIQTAKQLCQDPELRMGLTDTIGVWDAEEQTFINPITGQTGPDQRVSCNFIINVEDFDLDAGKVYEVNLPAGTIWTQR